MKKLAKIVALTALAYIICCGWARFYEETHASHKVVYFHEVVRAGDTFNGIVSNYYNGDEQGESWDNYQTRMKERNYILFHTEDGKPRMLQPGDIVCIECRIRIKK